MNVDLEWKIYCRELPEDWASKLLSVSFRFDPNYKNTCRPNHKQLNVNQMESLPVRILFAN